MSMPSVGTGVAARDCGMDVPWSFVDRSADNLARCLPPLRTTSVVDCIRGGKFGNVFWRAQWSFYAAKVGVG